MLRLCILLVLRGKFNEALVMLEVVCSSWVTNSRSSTGRTVLTPIGNTMFAKVRLANLMVSRTGFEYGDPP